MTAILPILAVGETSPMFGLLALVLVAVVLVSLVLVRFKQSLLVGYFVCGVVLANSGALGLVGAESEEVIQSLAELGVILLMFTIGVEFSVAEMRHLRRVALVGGGWQVGLVTLAAAGVAWRLRLVVGRGAGGGRGGGPVLDRGEHQVVPGPRPAGQPGGAGGAGGGDLPGPAGDRVHDRAAAAARGGRGHRWRWGSGWRC